MESVLINFIQICRRCGLKVSIAESLDGARAAMLVGMNDRPTFKAALRASLIKRTKDMPLFDQIFDAYFTDKPSDMPIEEMFGHGLPKPGDGDDDFDEAMRRAMEEMGGMDDLTRRNVATHDPGTIGGTPLDVPTRAIGSHCAGQNGLAENARSNSPTD
jgi:uncharacterized protein with von Willebrand factor type A (vWA) domain